MNPDEAIATGATIQVAVLVSDKATLWSAHLQDYSLREVAPLSLGIETFGGVMHPLIKRNAPHVLGFKQMFTYAELGCGDDHQSNMLRIKIYEGEAAMAKDNNLLGVLELTGIPPAPRDALEVEITFNIDAVII